MATLHNLLRLVPGNGNSVLAILQQVFNFLDTFIYEY